jgi:glutamine---fructose-6-phosphate transaminase (isomerizing)
MSIREEQYTHLNTWNEILSQGPVWQRVLDDLSHNRQVEKILANTSKRHPWIFVGCGTSFYLAEAAAFSWTLLTEQPARALPASEILLYPQLIKDEGTHSQAVVISRSGRTSEAVRAADVLKRDLRVHTLGITCAENSALQQVCDESVVLPAADEKSTVMTRSFTSMLICLQYLAARRAGDPQFLQDLRNMAVQFGPRIAPLAEEVRTFVESHAFADFVFLGQGGSHGIAREAALKVMEMSCSYSQFFHTLEFRHGPKAIVSPATCLTFFLGASSHKAESEVLLEMKELGGVTFAVCNQTEETVRRACDLLVELNFDVDELALLAPSVVPSQLLGLFTGLRKGLNPDQPKNLTRVVILD